MNNSTIKSYIHRAVFLIIIACRCTEPPVTGSETTSGVEIAVVKTTIHGTTNPGAVAILLNEEYSVNSIGKYADTMIADDTGGVAFTDLPQGKYNLYVFSDNALHAGTVLFGIPVNDWAQQNGIYTDTGFFSGVRNITGTVFRNNQPVPQMPVHIPGSPFGTATDSSGFFMFAGIPPARYSIVIPPISNSDRNGDSTVVDLELTEEITVSVSIDLGG